MSQQSNTSFTRDRFTWLAYLMLAYYAYLQAGLGPLMPFLRIELGLSYTGAGLHFSAFALGMILAGLSGDRFASRWGRAAVFWSGAAGMAAGALLLLLARWVGMTIAASFFMGLMGTLLLVIIQAALSDRHGNQRAIALTEANVAASIGATSVPLIIGLSQQFGLGWRSALLFAIGVLGLITWRYHGVTIPDVQQDSSSQDEKKDSLPLSFWAYWVVVVLGVAIEWSLVFWGADFLANAGGLSITAAATAMSAFFLAMILGRYGGSRLARRYSSASLLLSALVVALVGFILFWLARQPLLNVAGLFIAGLGVANHYPLILALGTGVASNQANKVSARISLGTGLAIFSAPLLLGWTADRLSIQYAFAIVFLLFAAAFAVTLIANRLSATS